jgi:DNA-binding MarR family transcriptional regulator
MLQPVYMGEALKRRIKQTADFANPAQEAMLNLMVAADYVHTRLERVCLKFGVTRPQYNVLRILRGVHPDGHSRAEIAARLLSSAPDVTRLVDRLQAQGLVERDRMEEDRRLRIARITGNGLRLLAGRGASLVRMQFGVSELRRAVDGDKQVEPPLRGVNLGNIKMEVADGVFSELLLRRLVTFDFGQATNAVSL